ncbi:GNAT family N-acetyltransferase [Desulfovibrio subterraneus]|uniref:GNAT family N-acetyltransferase n=1 Tax=Desulfovibrio subterraneus TaxID=2718620 RepID=UPI0022B919CA|nr:N-acetyltransferase [Desulfovibrio subterraneus]WBF66166.1 GNAT family N-acetyltransferase [Desulfovibrio subterraneus]
MTQISSISNNASDEERILRKVVSIHCKALADDLLPKLGKEYLLRTFYPTILQESDSLLLVEEDNDSVRGFILVANPANAYSHLRTGKRLSHLLSAALIRPNTWIDLIGAAYSKTHPPLTLPSSTFEIVALAVHPDFQRKGIGKILVSSALSRINNQSLLTKTSSDAALKFYFELGFTKIGVESRINKQLNVLKYTCPS